MSTMKTTFLSKHLTIIIQVAVSFVCMATLSGFSFNITESEVPITLQSLLMVWFAYLFGVRVGLTSVILYLIAGGFGLNVFSNGGSGWEQFQSVTGGFLLAFPIGALISGIASDWLKSKEELLKFKFISSALVLFVSQGAILLLGLYWYNSIATTTESIQKFTPGLLIKTAIGTMAYVVLVRTLFRPNKQQS